MAKKIAAKLMLEFVVELNGRDRRWTLYHRCNECIENHVDEYRDALLGSHVMQIFQHSYANVARDQEQLRNIRQNFDSPSIWYSHIRCM